MSDQPQELHNVIERRLLGPYKVALLLDNGSLVIMSSDNSTQVVLDAQASYNLLGLLYTHREMLDRLSQRQGVQAAQKEGQS